MIEGRHQKLLTEVKNLRLEMSEKDEKIILLSNEKKENFQVEQKELQPFKDELMEMALVMNRLRMHSKEKDMRLRKELMDTCAEMESAKKQAADTAEELLSLQKTADQLAADLEALRMTADQSAADLEAPLPSGQKGHAEKSVQTRNAGPAMEKWEPCYADGRDVNCQIGRASCRERVSSPV